LCGTKRAEEATPQHERMLWMVDLRCCEVNPGSSSEENDDDGGPIGVVIIILLLR
jgi:hypothetical protein